MEQRINLSFDNVSDGASNLMWGKYRTYSFIFIFLCLIILTLFVLSSLYLYGIIITLVIFSAYYSYILAKARIDLIRNFALQNGFVYKEIGDVSSLVGRLYEIGYSKYMDNEVSGLYSGLPIRFFNYSYCNKRDKRDDKYSYSVCEVVFDGNDFPFILLKSETIRGGSKHDMLKEGSVSLEKDYNKYFKLYTRKGFEIEAMQVFNYDVLDFLKEKAHHYNIEFIKDRMYIYDDVLVKRKSDLIELFDVTKKFIDIGKDLIFRLNKDYEAMYHSYGK